MSRLVACVVCGSALAGGVGDYAGCPDHQLMVGPFCGRCDRAGLARLGEMCDAMSKRRKERRPGATPAVRSPIIDWHLRTAPGGG